MIRTCQNSDVCLFVLHTQMCVCNKQSTWREKRIIVNSLKANWLKMIHCSKVHSSNVHFLSSGPKSASFKIDCKKNKQANTGNIFMIRPIFYLHSFSNGICNWCKSWKWTFTSKIKKSLANGFFGKFHKQFAWHSKRIQFDVWHVRIILSWL